MDSCQVLHQHMHWHTGKSLLNTLGIAVEQFAGCLAKVSSRGRTTTAMQMPAREVLMNINEMMSSGPLFTAVTQGHVHSPTHWMRHSACT